MKKDDWVAITIALCVTLTILSLPRNLKLEKYAGGIIFLGITAISYLVWKVIRESRQ